MLLLYQRKSFRYTATMLSPPSCSVPLCPAGGGRWRVVMATYDEVVSELRHLATVLENNANVISIDFIIFRLDALKERVFQLAAHMDTDVDNVVFQNLEEAAHLLNSVANVNHTPGIAGRPAYILPVDALEGLLHAGLPVGAIARLFGVSETTVYRRMAENDISYDLREHLLTLQTVGNRLMKANHLRLAGCHHVNYYSLAVDHGVSMRTVQLHTARRRRYSVPAPNSLWHIDGNHKLIRWRFVVHGGIDGFSRLIVYLKAATNNRASTVCKCFLEAVGLYGVPSRVRSDKGGENVQVAHFMVSTRGPNRNSHLTGRSTHNQRIERLWRDVFGAVLDLFYTTFCNLEAEGLLNPDNEIQLYALHWAFLPQLDRHLQLFKDGWNHHRLRTERNQSPHLLWSQNQREGEDPYQVCSRNKSQGLCQNTQRVDMDYGIDWESPHGHHPEGVPVPDVQVPRPLTGVELQRLPDPQGPFCNVLNVYSEAISTLTDIFGEV
uniref:Integrase catalytic domain-containing protein n=1 Tax=Fundulus heteroclitus TaxID=8078 RepID=A0A3Q2PM94_FUNHE